MVQLFKIQCRYLAGNQNNILMHSEYSAMEHGYIHLLSSIQNAGQNSRSVIFEYRFKLGCSWSVGFHFKPQYRFVYKGFCDHFMDQQFFGLLLTFHSDMVQRVTSLWFNLHKFMFQQENQMLEQVINILCWQHIQHHVW